MMGMRGVAAIGLVAIPLNHIVLARLLAMVEHGPRGDPFVAANAYRLQAIAWALLALQLLGLAIAAIAKRSPRPSIRSTSTPDFRSTAGSPCSSPSSSPGCSPRAR